MNPQSAFWLLLLASCSAAGWPQGHPITKERPAGGPAVSIRIDQAMVNRQAQATGIDTARPHFSWTLAALSSARGLRQSGYRIVVASSRESLMQNKGDLWDSGRTDSDKTMGIAYAGRPLQSHSRYFWRVCVWDQDGRRSGWSADGLIVTGMLDSDPWRAHWIAARPDTASREAAREGVSEVKDKTDGMPLFRRDFRVTKPIESAIAVIAGLGQYELRLNGRDVTDTVLNAGWTNYRKSILYNTYDLTRSIREGANALGVMLGNGIYNVEEQRGRYTKFAGSFGQPKMRMELHLHYRDGSEETVLSDGSWKTHAGPVTYSSTYGGEDFDARLEPAGWDGPEFASGGWDDAIEVQGPGGEMQSQKAPPIVVARQYDPARVTEPKPGVLVYDLGQNMSGWPSIEVRGRAGQTLKLVCGELLDQNGLVTQHSANAGPEHENSYSYTLSGRGTERWHPRFSYWGFRYVQVEGASRTEVGRRGEPRLVRLKGEFLHDRLTATGEFHASDELLNRIHRLIDMAILSNSFSVLTDCPHREKLGWLEQTYLNGSSLFFNYDYGLVYDKLSRDMREAQLADGMVPGIAPEYVAFVDANGVSTAFRDSPEWGSASILSPWTAYQFGGDLEALREAYPMMRRYAAYLESKEQDGLLSHGLGDWYDIGPGPPGYSQLTSKQVTATATLFEDLKVLEQASEALGKPEAAAHYQAEEETLKKAFNEKLFHLETDEYDRGSQTANAMALVTGLVPNGREKVVLDHLVEDIRKHGNHVTAGDVGFHYVVRALTDGGRSDVLYEMLSRTDSPSYGYQLSRGATTLTEAWDTNPDSSQNHFMLGHGEEWFYRGLAGIRVDMSLAPGEQLAVRPQPVGAIAAAQARYDSVLGTITSSWTQKSGDFELQVTFPPNTAATVEIPTNDSGSVTEDGRKALDSKGGSCRVNEGSVVCHVTSGTYRFASRL